MVRNNTQPAGLLQEHFAYASVIIFITAFICVNLLTPIVIRISFHKRLATPINERSSHLSRTPPFGGVTFYIIFILSISTIQSILGQSLGYSIIAAISILFIVGLKDDLIHSTAKAKLTYQLLAAVCIVLCTQLRIDLPFTNIYLYTGLSFFLSAFLVVLIINAYNLIDGIDGLAASMGIIISIVYAIIFYLLKDIFFSLLNIIIASTLIAFLRFNLSKNKIKIFMGDCGSLVIGLMISIHTLRFLALPISTSVHFWGYGFYDKFLTICVILFIPFLDTARIIILRLINGKNLFKADKNHVHHVLVNYGLSHIETSIILSTVQISIIIMFFLLSESVSLIMLSAVVVFAFVMSTLLLSLIDRKGNTRITTGGS